MSECVVSGRELQSFSLWTEVGKGLGVGFCGREVCVRESLHCHSHVQNVIKWL